MQRPTSLLPLLGLALALTACGQSPVPTAAGSATPDPTAPGSGEGLHPLALPPAGVYELHSACGKGDKVLEVVGRSQDPGAGVQIGTDADAAHQRWRLGRQGDGSYVLTAQHSGQVLDALGWGQTKGSPVGQWESKNFDNQRWVITDLGGGLGRLQPAHAPKLALDLAGARTNDGTAVQLWDNNGTCAQRWKFVPVPVPSPVPATGNPFEGASFLPAGPDSNAGQAAAKYRSSDPARAAQFDKIASQPAADWFGDFTPDVRAAIDARTTQLVAAGKLPVYALYNIPNRDNGQYSAGGAPDAAAYRAWIGEVVAGLGGRRAVVILEPDGVSLIRYLSAAQHAERMALLRDAAGKLTAAGASVYLEAGNWIPVDEIAALLTEAGVAGARGFALNVSQFQTTEEMTGYGAEVSARLGGKGFVIDTSRNGNGPYAAPNDPETWCNPPGRALGANPQAQPNPAVPALDAYYWIKRPGESDGSCRGFPSAGTWIESYAYDLARNRP